MRAGVSEDFVERPLGVPLSCADGVSRRTLAALPKERLAALLAKQAAAAADYFAGEAVESDDELVDY